MHQPSILGRPLSHLEVVIEGHVLVDTQPMARGGRGPSLVIIKQGFRLGKGHIVKFMEIGRGRHPVAMRRLVLAHHHKRLT